MEKSDIRITKELYEYIRAVSLREHEALRALREETAKHSHALLQIPPEQGQFMALLMKLIGARRTLEVGTYTGYSALCVALAMPADSLTVACDISAEWTAIGQKYWKAAGVENKIDLRIGPAQDTLSGLLEDGQAGTYDFAFIDADKQGYDGYYEKSLSLLRPGGLIAIDNVLLFGSVQDPSVLDETLRGFISDEDIDAIRALNEKIRTDERVEISLLTIADGLTLARKR
ncbi:MAG: class I SAM-dependent methyltransferase [Gammaproteobacteria bacterium]|jgi:caffeoyl-CoA O-methyltransferase|nr:class I SAM-dependent methyltransferase [Gammaproteobacteria bacterium]